jgi:hypothetical protein
VNRRDLLNAGLAATAGAVAAANEPAALGEEKPLFDLVRRKHFKTSDRVVFWHTGGTPGLFAYRDVF